MKKIIEKNVPENDNLFETIVDYMQKHECWIYISNRLSNRLKREYQHQEYACTGQQGMIYNIRNGKKQLTMYLDHEDIWNKVSCVSGYLKETSKNPDAPSVAKDPEYLIFLS